MYKLVICTVNAHENSNETLTEFEKRVDELMGKGYTPLPLVITPISFNADTTEIAYSQPLYKETR